MTIRLFKGRFISFNVNKIYYKFYKINSLVKSKNYINR